PHCRGQQGRHAQNVRMVPVQCRQILLHWIVDAEIDHLEPDAFHHHRDKIFPDVVDVVPVTIPLREKARTTTLSPTSKYCLAACEISSSMGSPPNQVVCRKRQGCINVG